MIVITDDNSLMMALPWLLVAIYPECGSQPAVNDFQPRAKFPKLCNSRSHS